MLTHAWRGRPRLRGVPDSPNAAERKGLVEHVYEMAVNQRVDTVLIEQKTCGKIIASSRRWSGPAPPGSALRSRASAPSPC